MATLIVGIRLGRQKKVEMQSSIIKRKFKKLIKKWVAPVIGRTSLKGDKPYHDRTVEERAQEMATSLDLLNNIQCKDGLPNVFLYKRTWYYGFYEKVRGECSVAPYRIQSLMDRVRTNARHIDLPIISFVCKGSPW